MRSDPSATHVTRADRARRWLLGAALLLGACGEAPLADFAYTPPEDWTTRGVAAARSDFPVAIGPARDGVAAGAQ
jgi:hypothetical protein